MQKIMRFVNHDPVRQASGPPDRRQHRQKRFHVIHFFLIGRVRQIDHHAHIRVTQHPREIRQFRRRIFPAEHDHSRQSFQRAVVAFGIDHADRVPLQY